MKNCSLGLTVGVLILSALISHSAFGLSQKSTIAFRNDCAKFVKVNSAQQRRIAETIGFTPSALRTLCRQFLSHSIAEDERVSRVPTGHFQHRGDAGSAGTPDCSTDGHGHTSCSYEGQSSASDLNCGSASAGGFVRCTDSNGLPSNVSCYTNQSGYTSCN